MESVHAWLVNFSKLIVKPAKIVINLVKNVGDLYKQIVIYVMYQT